jgi:hypothetical protein
VDTCLRWIIPFFFNPLLIASGALNAFLDAFMPIARPNRMQFVCQHDGEPIQGYLGQAFPTAPGGPEMAARAHAAALAGFLLDMAWTQNRGGRARPREGFISRARFGLLAIYHQSLDRMP